MNDEILDVIVAIAHNYSDEEVAVIAKFLDEVVEVSDSEEIMRLVDRLNSEYDL